MATKDSANRPLVSVIMPAYNAQAFIREAIGSVQAQTVRDWELIVIDDGSKDRTRQLVAELAEADSRIRLEVNPDNLGAAGTRNRGLELSRGQHVALLDSDDYWQPQLLEKMLHRMAQTGADIVYCSYAIVDETGKRICDDFIVPEQTDLHSSMIRNVISCSTALFSRKIAETARFPVGMYHEDIALWFQLLSEGVVARGVPEVLACYRQHGGSKTANKLTSACRRWVIYRKHLKLPVLQSVGLMVQYGYYGIMKYKKRTTGE